MNIISYHFYDSLHDCFDETERRECKCIRMLFPCRNGMCPCCSDPLTNASCAGFAGELLEENARSESFREQLSEDFMADMGVLNIPGPPKGCRLIAPKRG